MPRRIRIASLIVTLAVLLGSATAAAATNSAAPSTYQPRPDAPTIMVPDGAMTSALADGLVGWARFAAGGVVPQIPVDQTGFDYLRLGDVNNYGVVAGYGAESSYRGSARDLIHIQNGTTTIVGTTGSPDPLGDRSAYGMAINDNGAITGVAPCQCRRLPDGVPASIAFRWSAADGFTFAPMPAGVIASTGVAINDDDVVLVNSWASPDPADDGAWLWDTQEGTLVRLPDLGGGGATGTALDNDGTAVGYAPVGDVNHAVRWGWGRRHRITDLAPGDVPSQANDLNEDGTIVGSIGTHAVAWLADGRRIRDLGEGEALAINDNDQVAGNVVIAHLAPTDGSPTVTATIAAVYDLWAPDHRVVLDTKAFSSYLPTRLNDDGLVVNDDALFGPADPS